MQRRTLLRSLGAAGLGAALAGCLSNASPGGGGDTTAPSEPDTASQTPTDRHTDTRPADKRTTGDGTTSPSDEDGPHTKTVDDEDGTNTPGDDEDATSTPDGTDGSSWNPAAEKPFEIVEVGSRDDVSFPNNNRPHEVAVLNELDRKRDIHVSITAGAATGPDFGRTFTFPAGGWVLVRLNVPSQYEVALRASGTTIGSATVGRQWFDCNGSRSRFGVRADGVADYEERTTLMACPGPEVAGTDLTATDRGCASKDASGATVSFADEAVTVDGSIVTATPCRKLAIETAKFDETTGQLTIAIGTSPSDGVCQQCIGAVEYEASIAFEHDLPGEVVVEHRSRNGSRTVATASRENDA
jgi:hypothetical protein